MSTSLAGAAPQAPLAYIPGLKVAVVKAQWNAHITDALTDGAIGVFRSAGYPDDTVTVYEVPGTVELTYAARRLMDKGIFDAIIIFGCVIRGGTPHFDYVCQSVTQGMTQLNIMGKMPVIFGVLTVDTEADAIDRAGGKLGNKGAEAAQAAIMMADRYGDRTANRR